LVINLWQVVDIEALYRLVLHPCVVVKEVVLAKAETAVPRIIENSVKFLETSVDVC